MKHILKQASSLFASQILVRVISFFYMIFLARSLGVEQFGLFATALAYFSLASAFVDFGFNRYLMREVAINESRKKDLIWNISLLRLTIFAVFFALMSVSLYIFDENKLRVLVILLSLLALFPHSIAQTLDGVFLAIGKVKLSSIGMMILSIFTTISGASLVWLGYGPMGAAIALIVGHLIYMFFLLIALSGKQMLSLSKIETSTLKEIFLGVLPYGILGILGLIYFRIDTLILSYMKGNFETGIYSVGYKFLEASFFIPGSLAFVIFPQFAGLQKQENRSSVRKLYISSVSLMGIIGFLLMLGFLIFLPPLINYLLPQYQQSIQVIQILSLTIPFMFIHSVSVQILFSIDKYLKQIIYLSFITISFNIIANILLIPKYGIIGVSWVTVLSEVLSFIVFFILILRKKLI